MVSRRKRILFGLCSVVAIVIHLLLNSSFWSVLNSVGYDEKTISSIPNISESLKENNSYLEYVQNGIVSRLQQIENTSTDYLIYDCTQKMKQDCGGWNDRVTGVVNTLMLSIVVNKRFRLTMNKPCEIKEHFVSNKINWTVKSDIMSAKNMSILRFSNHLIFHLDKKNVSRNFPSHVNLFRNSWDATDVFRVTPNIREKIPWICNVHHADIYKLIFEAVFKPTDSILRPISELHLNKSKKLVCAHVRIGHNDKVNKDVTTVHNENRFPFKNISLIFDFLAKFDATTHQFYIATDSPKVKKLSKEVFHKNLIDIPGKIMHVEFDRGKDECEGYTKSLRDWWMLTKCDVLVLTQSGYGAMAAYLLDNSKPLYCANAEKLVPCNRYDIIEHFPLEMHIPKFIPISRRHNKTHDYCPPGELQLTKNLPVYLKPLIS